MLSTLKSRWQKYFSRNDVHAVATIMRYAPTLRTWQIFMIFLPFPHHLALDARAEVYSLQLSGLIKGRNSVDWFDQQKHRHLNCTIESHFCSAREMSLVSRASAQMQIRLKSFRQTIQACARENTFQGNNWD